jgi:pimeloyl-ACP methyl ester carboxylesterase
MRNAKTAIGFFFCFLLAQVLCAHLARSQSNVEVISYVELGKELTRSQGAVYKPIKIIFIPGILGSKLTDPETNQLIWGGIGTTNPKLKYDGSTSLAPSFFDRAEINLFFWKPGVSVYGDAIQALQKLEYVNEEDILPFAYDWRQSNRKSAKNLNDWLCDKSDVLANNNIIFVAHSMGGLVLKNWFMDFYDADKGCRETEKRWLKVRNVVFVGTPHYGSPKAFNALVGGFTLFDDWLRNKLTSEGLKKYGHSFRSLYELLPLQNNGNCNPAVFGNDMLEPAVAVAGAGQAPSAFDVQFLSHHELPKDIDGAPRQEFYATFLTPTLESALARSCELAGYRFPVLGMGNVVTIYGVGPTSSTDRNTIQKVVWESGKWNTETANGDGTVVKQSAAWVAALPSEFYSVPANSTHQDLLDNSAVQELIARPIRHIMSEQVDELQRKDAQAFTGLTQRVAAREKFLPVPLPGDSYAIAVRAANAEIFRQLNWSSERISAEAKRLRQTSLSDNELGMALNDYVSQSPNYSALERFVAAQSVGKELSDLKFKAAAYEQLSGVITDQQSVKGTSSATATAEELDELLAKTLNTRGTLNQAFGNIEAARKDYEGAIELGSTRAIRNLQALEIFR